MDSFLPASHLPGIYLRDRLHLKDSEMWRQSPDQHGFMLSSTLRAKSLWRAARKFPGESMYTVILRKCQKLQWVSACLTQDLFLGLCFESQAHRSTTAEIWKFSSVAAPPLQGTGNSAQEFQGRAQFGYSSSPLVASNGFNLQLEPPGINKRDVNLPLLDLSPVIWFPLMCRNLSL